MLTHPNFNLTNRKFCNHSSILGVCTGAHRNGQCGYLFDKTFSYFGDLLNTFPLFGSRPDYFIQGYASG